MTDERAREIRIERKERWDWLHLRLGKANAVGPLFLSELTRALDDLGGHDADGAARPLLVTGEGASFSAGLDLPALLTFDRARQLAFLRSFHRVFLRFACLPRPTLAAVNGHAVAGGAVLALACDERIGVRRIATSGKAPLLGVNEVALGLPFPRAAAAIVEHGLGGPARAAELMLTGRLVGPDEALGSGLLHRLVEPDALAPAVEERAACYAAGSGRAVAGVKAYLRRELAALGAQDVDDSAFVDAWFAPGTQQRLRAVVARLTERQPG